MSVVPLIKNIEKLGKKVHYSMDKLRVVKGCSVMRFFHVMFKVMLNTSQSIFNLFLAGAYTSIVLMVI